MKLFEAAFQHAGVLSGVDEGGWRQQEAPRALSPFHRLIVKVARPIEAGPVRPAHPVTIHAARCLSRGRGPGVHALPVSGATGPLPLPEPRGPERVGCRRGVGSKAGNVSRSRGSRVPAGRAPELRGQSAEHTWLRREQAEAAPDQQVGPCREGGRGRGGAVGGAGGGGGPGPAERAPNCQRPADRPLRPEAAQRGPQRKRPLPRRLAGVTRMAPLGVTLGGPPSGLELWSPARRAEKREILEAKPAQKVPATVPGGCLNTLYL